MMEWKPGPMECPSPRDFSEQAVKWRITRNHFMRADYLAGMSYAAVGRKYGLNRQSVRDIIQSLENKHRVYERKFFGLDSNLADASLSIRNKPRTLADGGVS